MSIESDNEIAAYILRKVLEEAGIGISRDLSLSIMLRLDEVGWELREYKYNMTPERWQQMGERQVNP